MKKFKFTIQGESFEVSVNEESKNVAEVTVNGKPYSVEIERDESGVKRTPITRRSVPKGNPTPAPTSNPNPVAKKPGGSKSVKSPLPGSIFKVLVSAGQAVKRGDLLLIIESMKMENNILADRDGIVKSIYVQPGNSVLQGDALLDLE
jgi:biotin carboxyl carrier protein